MNKIQLRKLIRKLIKEQIGPAPVSPATQVGAPGPGNPPPSDTNNTLNPAMHTAAAPPQGGSSRTANQLMQISRNYNESQKQQIINKMGGLRAYPKLYNQAPPDIKALGKNTGGRPPHVGTNKVTPLWIWAVFLYFFARQNNIL